MRKNKSNFSDHWHSLRQVQAGCRLSTVFLAIYHVTKHEKKNLRLTDPLLFHLQSVFAYLIRVISFSLIQFGNGDLVCAGQVWSLIFFSCIRSQELYSSGISLRRYWGIIIPEDVYRSGSVYPLTIIRLCFTSYSYRRRFSCMTKESNL